MHQKYEVRKNEEKRGGIVATAYENGSQFWDRFSIKNDVRITVQIDAEKMMRNMKYRRKHFTWF